MLIFTAVSGYMFSFAPFEQRGEAALRRTACAEIFGQQICIQPLAASAAIPSISEYDAVQYRKAAPLPTTDGTVDLTPTENFKLALSGLQRADKLLERGSLEEVRSLLREPVFSRFLGYSPGVRGNAQNLKPSAALVAAGASGDDLRDLLLSLKRVDDFCIANRVIVFNVEDIAQVNELMKSSGRDGSEGGRLDVSEAREALADARELLEAARGQVNK